MRLIHALLRSVEALGEQTAVELRRGVGVLKHPVCVCDDDAFFLCEGGAGGHGDGGLAGVVDGRGAVPGDVLVAIVGFSFRRETVLRVGEVAFDGAGSTLSGLPVVVGHLSAGDDNTGAKFAEDGARGDDADGASFVGMWDELTLDHVEFFVVVHNNLEQLLVFLEEQVRVAKPDAARGLGGKHIKTVTASQYRERTTTVLTPALEIAHFGDLVLASGVLGEDDLVVLNSLRVTIFVEGDGSDVRGSTAGAHGLGGGGGTAATLLGGECGGRGREGGRRGAGVGANGIPICDGVIVGAEGGGGATQCLIEGSAGWATTFALER